MTPFSPTKAASLLVACGLSIVVHAQAGIVSWSNNGGTKWVTSSNWSTGVPGAGDVALFGPNPTDATGIQINMSGTNNLSADDQIVGAIEISAARTANSANVDIGDGSSTSGTLTLNGATVNSVNDVILDNESANNLNIQPSNSGSGILTVALDDTTNNIVEINGGSGGGNITVSCNITQVSSGMSLTVAGSGGGQLDLTGTDSFSGGLNILGAEVDVAADNALGASGDSVTINGGRFASVSGSSFTISSSRSIYLGSAAGTSFDTAGSSGVVTYNGAFLDLTGTTHGILVKQGSGTLDIGGASTYTGATSINNGTIQLTTGNNRLPAGTILNIGQSASSNLGTLDLHGLNQQIAGLTSTPGTNSSASTNTITSTSTAATLTINGTGSYSYGTNSAANSGVIMGPVSLVMEGGGTETLGGSNSYTGSTTVSGATLIVSGSLTSTSSVSVSSGTLELSASNAIANSAPLTLSTGVLLDATNNKATFASLTTSGASTLDLGVSSTASILNFGDSHGIAWSGTLTIANWNGTTTSGGPDEVFFGSSAGGLTSTQLGDIAFLNPTINGVAKTGDYNANILSTGQIVAVVPEPATWAAMLSGLAALVLIECRRSRRRGAPMPDSRRPKQLGRLRSNRL